MGVALFTNITHNYRLTSSEFIVICCSDQIINLFVYKDLLFFKLNNQALLSCCQRLFVDPP